MVCLSDWLTIWFLFCPPLASAFGGITPVDIHTTWSTYMQKNILYVLYTYLSKSWCGITYQNKNELQKPQKNYQTGMHLDFVNEKELLDLGNVAGNKPTFRVSPADQLHVQNKSNALFSCCLTEKLSFSCINGSLLCSSCWMPFLRTQPDTDVWMGERGVFNDKKEYRQRSYADLWKINLLHNTLF